MGLQGVTGGYNGLQEVTRGYRGLPGVTGGYRGKERTLKASFLCRTTATLFLNLFFINTKYGKT